MAIFLHDLNTIASQCRPDAFWHRSLARWFLESVSVGEEQLVLQQVVQREDQRQADELPAGSTLLRGLYRIEDYMVRGGFGITYRALDTLDREYVIKECFPGALCCRIGGKVKPLTQEYTEQFASVLRHFLHEARRVARLNHPGIVRVHQVFEENETAYIVMEVVEGADLMSVIEDEPERLTSAVIERAFRDALQAITYIHDLGILHRDIAPDNLILGPDGHLTLIDFGAAREQAGRENRALSALLAVKDGYSPHEFYLTDVEQSARSDLYSLGATFYHLITGEAPPNSQDRVAAIAADKPDPCVPLAEGDWDFDPLLLETIDRALAVLPQDRPATAREWAALLDTPQPDAPDEPPVETAADGEPDLQRVISRLVEDTNRNVTQGMPGSKDRYTGPRRRNRKTEADTAEPRQLVDIFGNPISDVEMWMREQEKVARARPRAVGHAEAAKAGAEAGTGRSAREKGTARPSLKRFFTSRLPLRRMQATSPVHN